MGAIEDIIGVLEICDEGLIDLYISRFSSEAEKSGNLPRDLARELKDADMLSLEDRTYLLARIFFSLEDIQYRAYDFGRGREYAWKGESKLNHMLFLTPPEVEIDFRLSGGWGILPYAKIENANPQPNRNPFIKPEPKSLSELLLDLRVFKVKNLGLDEIEAVMKRDYSKFRLYKVNKSEHVYEGKLPVYAPSKAPEYILDPNAEYSFALTFKRIDDKNNGVISMELKHKSEWSFV